MKAKQQAAEKAAKEDAATGEETSCPDTQEPRPQGAPAASSSLPLDEGLSLANSPLKPPGQSLTRRTHAVWHLSALLQPWSKSFHDTYILVAATITPHNR